MSRFIAVPESIATERLILRPWQPADAPALYEAVDESRDHLRPWMPWVAYYTDRSAAATFIEQAVAGWNEGDSLPLGIFDRATGRPLGGAGWHSTVAMPGGWLSLETGYWLRASAAGQGYMREAVRGEIRLAFEEWQLGRLTLRCDARNLPSRRVAEGCGFHLDASLRCQNRTHQGILRDTLVFSLLPDEAAALVAEWRDEHFAVEWSGQEMSPHPTAPTEQTARPEFPAPARIQSDLVTLRVNVRPADGAGRRTTLDAFDRSGDHRIGDASIELTDPEVPFATISWLAAANPADSRAIGAALVRFAFDTWRVNRVELRIPADQGVDRQLAAELNFVEEGTLRREYSALDDRITDRAVYALTSSDFAAFGSGFPPIEP